MAQHLHRWMAVVALVVGLVFLGAGLYLVFPAMVGSSQFAPSAAQTEALTNGTKFSNPQGCTSDDSLTPPDLVVSSAQTGEVLTVRVGDQILVADSESPCLSDNRPSVCYKRVTQGAPPTLPTGQERRPSTSQDRVDCQSSTSRSSLPTTSCRASCLWDWALRR